MSNAIPGTLRVSNDVIADLAGYAAMECYGVVGMAYTDAQNDIVTILSLKMLRKGIDVTTEDDKVVVTLHVVVDAGVNMKSVTENLKSAVKFMLAQVAEIHNVEVRVHIEDMKVQ
jgi:uncharacterized alkaline shock family protein YloU